MIGLWYLFCGLKGVTFHTNSIISDVDAPVLIPTLANADVLIAKVKVVNTCFFHFCNS